MTAPNESGTAFAAGVATEKAAQAEEVADEAAAQAETAVAMAEATATVTANENAETRDRVAEATETAWDARAAVDELRADTDARLAAILEAVTPPQTDDEGDSVATPPERNDTPNEADKTGEKTDEKTDEKTGGGQADDEADGQATKKKRPAHGMSRTWWGE